MVVCIKTKTDWIYYRLHKLYIFFEKTNIFEWKYTLILEYLSDWKISKFVFEIQAFPFLTFTHSGKKKNLILHPSLNFKLNNRYYCKIGLILGFAVDQLVFNSGKCETRPAAAVPNGENTVNIFRTFHEKIKDIYCYFFSISGLKKVIWPMANTKSANDFNRLQAELFYKQTTSTSRKRRNKPSTPTTVTTKTTILVRKKDLANSLT